MALARDCMAAVPEATYRATMLALLGFDQRNALKYIAVPTLVLNARNDPFIPEPSLPGSHDCSPSVTLHQPAEGGHVGFVTGGFPGHLSWLPIRLARFFETGA